MFTNKRILITGNISWEHLIVDQLLSNNPREIIMFRDTLEEEALKHALEGVDYVFHLAGITDVSMCEDQPFEAVKMNVIGTQHVIHASAANHVKKVIYLSIDKADHPSNVYELTKAAGERLITHANLLYSETQFIAVRAAADSDKRSIAILIMSSL